MRHLRSILYALVLAPAIWVLCGVGFTGDLVGRARDNTGTVETITGLLMLLLAGAAYGILLFSPVSPAGPLLGGLAYLGMGSWSWAVPAAYAAAWPPGLSKDGFDLSLPGYGLALVLAVPMICTALSARRWARYEPPVLPLIGALGWARGSAAVAGEPIAAAQTIAFPTEHDEKTQLIRLTDNDQTVEVHGEQETQDVRSEQPTADVHGEAATEAVLTDQPTADVRGADATEAVPVDDPTTDVQAKAEAEGATEPVLVTDTAPAEDDPDRNTVAFPLVGERSTADLGTRTRKFGPGEKTVVIARDPGEKTQVIRMPGAVYPPPGETTRDVRPTAGRVDPPGERTQVICLPAAAEEPATPNSIVSAERPDPGADPTTRLIPPPSAAETTVEQKPAETTAARAMTVMNMERPTDEAQNDDTRKFTIPTQRQPPEG